MTSSLCVPVPAPDLEPANIHPTGPGSLVERLLSLAPFLAFLTLLVVTRDRWIVPFRDTGREVQMAQRLLDGEVLYRDFVCWYGPLPSLLDAMVLGLYRHLDALIALRVAFALAGVAALQRVIRLVSGDRAFAASLATLVVTGCFFLPCGGAVPFPYSVAALEGTVGCWVALSLALGSSGARATAAAAVIAGLAAGTKLELAPAALLALAPALLARRPRREALAAIGGAIVLGSAAWVAPVALFGAGVIREHGYLLAAEISSSVSHFYRDLLFGGYGADLFAPSQLAVQTLAVVHAIAAVALARRGGPARAALLFLMGAATFALPDTGILSAYVPAAIALLGVVLLVRPSWPNLAGLACLGLAMLAPVARQPLAMRGGPYTPFTAPLALAFSLACLAFLANRRRAFAAFVFGLAFGQAGARVLEVRAEPRVLARFPEGRLRLPAPEARLLRDLVSRLRADTPPGSFVAAFPDGGLVLFLAGRRSPFADDQFHPGAQEKRAERELLAGLDQRPLAAAFFLNRRHTEFGAGVFGLDYGQDVLAALRDRLPSATITGSHDSEGPCILADQALYLRPASPDQDSGTGDRAPRGPAAGW